MRVRLNLSRLQDLLARSTLTQNHWALKLGLSRGHWSEIVHGKYPFPSPTTRRRMLEAFEVPFEELFEIEPSPSLPDASFQAALADRYLIDREIGQGGMGTVYLARDGKLGRVVAIKVVSPEVVSGIGVQAFLREVGYVARLQHPHIVPLFDAGEAAGFPYYVMPYFRDGSLRDLLTRQQALPVGDAMPLLRGVAAALRHAHARQVLHCDVKPGNILLDDGHAYVADFGVARALQAEALAWGRRGPFDASVGTPAYVSPEQATGEPQLDGRSDLYSLGCVAFEMLAGRPPFAGGTTREIVARRFSAAPPDLAGLVPALPPGVAPLIEQAMACQRSERQGSVMEFMARLERAATSRMPAVLVKARHRLGRGSLRLRARLGLARESRLRGAADRWGRDLRYAARGLRRDRLVSVFVILALALGVGVNVTSLTLADRLLLREPAHVTGADRLIRIFGRDTMIALGDRTTAWLPYATYRHLRDEAGSFEDLGAYRTVDAVVGRGSAARTLRVVQTTGAYFSMLGVRPRLGRFFAADEDAATTGFTAVVGERLWRSDLGGDPGVVGRTLLVGDDLHAIVGVAPDGFTGVEWKRTDLWSLADSRQVNTVNWQMVARLRPGVTPARASAEAEAVHRRTADDTPPGFRWVLNTRLFAGPLRSEAGGQEPLEATLVRWLAVASSIILLVTLANVVSLLMARQARRHHELAIRAALGAGRGRVLRLLAMEGLLLVLAGGLVAVLVIRLTEPVLRRTLLAGDAWWTLSFGDTRSLAALAGVLALTGLVLGLSLAAQAHAARPEGALRKGTHTAGRARVRAVLTVAQAALSVVLLLGAGLFLRSLANVRALDLGIERDRAITAEAILDRSALATPGSFRDYMAVERELYRRLAEAARAVPGVERAAIAIGLPLDGGRFAAGIRVPGQDTVPPLPDRGPHISTVGAHYFDAVGTRILRGRPFSEADREGSEPVLIVGETTARTLWPGRDALGRCIQVGGADAPCARVVGVAADVRRTGLRGAVSLQVYIPLGQQSMFGGAALVVRPNRNGRFSALALQEAMQAVDPSIRTVEVRALDAVLQGETRPLRLGTLLFGLSGGLAFLVAVLGLYGLMAHMVTSRTREIGVRLALGATPGEILRAVVRAGTGLAGVGILAGLALAVVGGHWLEPHLFETRASDPIVAGGVVLTLLSVALLAGWIPARRAARVNPTEALRAE